MLKKNFVIINHDYELAGYIAVSIRQWARTTE